MNDIIIIDAFTGSDERNSILEQSIIQLKKLNKDILLVSNSIISEKIISLVNYFIYDSEDILLPKKMSPIFWIANDKIKLHVFCKSNNLSVTRKFKIALNFLNTLGYSFFYFLLFDSIIHNNDLPLFQQLKDETLNNNNSAFFFEFQDRYDNKYYETKFFGGIINYFLSKEIEMIFPLSIHEWEQTYFNVDYCNTESLERILYRFLSGKTGIQIYKNKIKDFFKLSVIDVFTIFHRINIIYNEIEPKNPIIVINNYNKQATFTIFINDKFFKEFILSNEEYIYDFLGEMEHYSIKIKKDGEKVYEKNFNFSQLERLKEYGTFSNIN